MVGVSQKPELCPVYFLNITLGVGDGADVIPVTFSAECIGMAPPVVQQQHVGLLGRFFLSFMKFIYDGPKGTFELIPNVPQPATQEGRRGTKAPRDEAKGAGQA
jgi:hypothetical protein